MDAEFDKVRENLLAECTKIQNINTESRDLAYQGSWGGDGQRVLAAVGNKIKDSNYEVISDYEVRMIIRAYVTDVFTITNTILPRIQVIQASCLKILSTWNGVSSDMNEFRFIVERYASLNDLANKIEGKLEDLQVKNWDDFLTVNNLCYESIGTRFDWLGLLDKKFEDMKDTDYKFREERDIQDMGTKSIMSAIDRVGRSRMQGLRPFYNYCCEFVHPNLGDSIGCSLNVEFQATTDGQFLRRRLISARAKPIHSNFIPNHDAVFITNSYVFIVRVLADLQTRIPGMLRLIEQSKKIAKRKIHKMVKKNRAAWKKNELCPCASGKTIRDCK